MEIAFSTGPGRHDTQLRVNVSGETPKECGISCTLREGPWRASCTPGCSSFSNVRQENLKEKSFYKAQLQGDAAHFSVET